MPVFFLLYSNEKVYAFNYGPEFIFFEFHLSAYFPNDAFFWLKQVLLGLHDFLIVATADFVQFPFSFVFSSKHFSDFGFCRCSIVKLN